MFSRGDGLSGDTAYAIFEDRERNVWVSTIDGLDRFRENAVATLTTKQGLSAALVESILSDRNGSVWIATVAGLNVLDHGKVAIPSTGSSNRDGKLGGSSPGSLFQDDRGRIWVSTTRELGYLENGRFTSIGGVPAGPKLSITQETAGNVWAIDEPVGLIRISPKNIPSQIAWADLGHTDNATVLIADHKQGGLWVGFDKGGIIYLLDGQIRAPYTTANGLGAGRVSDFLFGNEAALWVSTEGGLSRLKDNRVATLTSRNGLPCDAVHWAIVDNEGSMWLYTACGLVRIAQSELDAWATAVDKDQNATPRIHSTLFDITDGVKSLSVPAHTHPLADKTPDGKLWFNPWDGVSVIDPHNLHENKLAPPVYVEKIVADDKTYHEPGNGVRLPTGVRYLTIDYTALSLVAPEKVHFRYKLEGQDKDWREVVNDREVQYSNLAPKHYKFRVLASNNSGVWNEEGAVLDFVIPPAWYQTNWFRAACAAAFLAMLWGIYELRVRQLAAQFNIRLEERLAERTRIARDLHDTLLQSFQGLVLRLQAVLIQIPKRPEKAYEVLESALVSADQAIAEGRTTVQELRSGAEGTLEQVLLDLSRELAASQNGADNGPTVRVIVEGTRKPKRSMISDEVHRIARELLRNAYRHAHAQKIEAELRYDDDAFLLVVRDDGKGIDPKVLKDRGRAGHWGLPGMYERAEGMGARLEILSEAGAGAEVRLRVPAAIAYEKSRDGVRFKLFRKNEDL